MNPEQLQRRHRHAYIRGWECGAAGGRSDAEMLALDVVPDYAQGHRDGEAARQHVRNEREKDGPQATITGKEIRLVRIERGDCKCGTEVTVLSVELDDRPGTILDANIDGIVLAIPYMDAAGCLEHEVVYLCYDCARKLYVEQQKGSS